ncbi:recombinase family protein [Rossellomorea oryzaecorticis]|uniref:Recombinase family protein n=1 Tax=Rossellomorea oryzaecorticis TaxID=1396505 RepID=A0ABU9K8G2_9BACI
MYKVGAYARVSTQREEQRTSIENQKLMFESYVDNNGWSLSELYIDKATGTKGKRKELLRLIEDIKEKKIDVVLVKDLSRLARNGQLSYSIANLMQEKGVHIISLDGMVNSLEGNVQNFGLLAWMYQQESENLSRKIKSTKEIGAINGKYQGSTPPFGYEIVKGKLSIRNDETPAIVKRIFSEYINGIGVDTIAKNLTLEEVPTPAQVIGKKNAGVEWRGNTIKTILLNPHYTGHLVQSRTSSISVVSTKRKIISKEDQVVVENTHKAIISKDVFETAEQQMKLRRKNKTAPKLHLFTNVAFCKDCGKGMWYRSSGVRYICGSYGRYGKSKCSSHAIKEVNLKQAITCDIDNFLSNLDMNLLSKQFEKKIKNALSHSTKEKKNIEDKITVIKNRKVKFAKMLADDQLDFDTYKSGTNEANNELEKLNKQKQMLDYSSNQNKVDLKKLHTDFKKFLYSEEVLPELVHRFILRIEIDSDGAPNIFYNFSKPKKALVF